jgi:hypothetical protein
VPFYFDRDRTGSIHTIVYTLSPVACWSDKAAEPNDWKLIIHDAGRIADGEGVKGIDSAHAAEVRCCGKMQRGCWSPRYWRWQHLGRRTRRLPLGFRTSSSATGCGGSQL